jgi:hypothetical protein
MKNTKNRLFEMMERLNPNSTKTLIKEEAEGQYYKPKLEDIIKNAQEILQGIGDKDELDAWVQDKITIAHHNMDAILDYMKSTQSDDQNESNLLKGGKADGMSIEDIAKQDKLSPDLIKQQLKKGEKVEKEHTNNPEIAKEISMDHLEELPDYYDRLDKMEKNKK